MTTRRGPAAKPDCDSSAARPTKAWSSCAVFRYASGQFTQVYEQIRQNVASSYGMVIAQAIGDLSVPLRRQHWKL